jgi:drug/metabolite transporter (DMT)-like permease
VALCLASAVGFAAMAIFAKKAYAGGANVPTLLALRFGLASLTLWALVRTRARGLPRTAPAGVRAHVPGFALGVLYAVEASAWFFALTRIDAALGELLLYGYPAVVIAGAALLGREPITRARLRVLALITAGLVLVLAAGSISAVDLAGLIAALSTTFLYATYVLVSDRVVAERDPILVSAQITTSAALLFFVYGLATSSLDFGALDAQAWVAALSLTVLSTVVPILAFLEGMKRVGVGTATLLSTAEPVVTVGLAMVVLGERLAPIQLLGGALVVAALVVLSRASTPAPPPGLVDVEAIRGDGYARGDAAAPALPAAAAPAREVREHAALG